MTERLIWTPDDPENEPFVRANLPSGESFEMRRDNTTLFTFLGSLALFNHAFYCEKKDDEVETALYIFNHAEGYNELAEYMIENNYPMVLNQTSVPGCDQDAYFRSATHDIDTVPDEWQ